MSNTQLELGLALRDGGAETALANAGEDWHTTAVNLILQYFKEVGWKGALFEDARTYATMRGIGAPPSPNAWGAVALSLSKRNLITKTGALLPSKDVRSHARAQPVWRLTNIKAQSALDKKAENARELGLDYEPAQQQEPESFEQWNAKQHGDPEEIGFLQALRIAYCAGQDSVTNSQPAQRTWVGLTDEEMDDCWNKLFGTGNYNRRNVYRAIEAKLKEKNT